jgi:hypothetical protein
MGVNTARTTCRTTHKGDLGFSVIIQVGRIGGTEERTLYQDWAYHWVHIPRLAHRYRLTELSSIQVWSLGPRDIPKPTS